MNTKKGGRYLVAVGRIGVSRRRSTRRIFLQRILTICLLSFVFCL